MALVGDPLEPRFRMMAGTAQAGDTLLSGAAKSGVAFFLKIMSYCLSEPAY